jgi:Domain of unknown function (DUF305)
VLSTLIDGLRTLALAEVAAPVLHRESVVVGAFSRRNGRCCPGGSTGRGETMSGVSHGSFERAFVFAMVLIGVPTSIAGAPDESAFLAENDAAMKRMMVDMAIKPSGDADRDFAAMMIAHHQGAIAMAQAQLRYGRNEQLRRLAQAIIVSQSEEIAVMRLAVAELAVPSAASPTESSRAPGHAHPEGGPR